MVDENQRVITFYIPSFERGGVERLIINLTKELLSRDIVVNVLVRETDSTINQLDDRVNVERLESLAGVSSFVHGILPPHVANAILSLPAYVTYLRQTAPDLLISMQTSPFAVLGATIAGRGTTVAIRESNTPSVATRDSEHTIGRLALLAKRLTYPQADHVIAVSEDAATDITDSIGIPCEDVSVIYNPTYSPEIEAKADEPIDHPWFSDEDVPILVSVGRFSDQKDFETLLRAFAMVKDERPVRLVLVGDGKNKQRLEQLTSGLGLENNVEFVGYQSNPYKFMAKADLFVLSSRYEGLPNVLIEAIGVGTPVIATDCPSGPREILLDGEAGTLVPVGHEQALAEAIVEALENPKETAEKLSTARENLDRFTPERAAAEYLSLLDRGDA